MICLENQVAPNEFNFNMYTGYRVQNAFPYFSLAFNLKVLAQKIFMGGGGGLLSFLFMNY